MKRIILFVVAAAWFWPEAATANSFLAGLVGTWDVVTVVQVGSAKETVRTTVGFRKLKNGVYYGVAREKGKKEKVGETWYYRNGSLLSIEYDGGAVYGEGTGKWRVRNGRLTTGVVFEGLDGTFRMDGAMRKVSRNRYTEVGTVSSGSFQGRYTISITRARK